MYSNIGFRDVIEVVTQLMWQRNAVVQIRGMRYHLAANIATFQKVYDKYSICITELIIGYETVLVKCIEYYSTCKSDELTSSCSCSFSCRFCTPAPYFLKHNL